MSTFVHFICPSACGRLFLPCSPPISSPHPYPPLSCPSPRPFLAMLGELTNRSRPHHVELLCGLKLCTKVEQGILHGQLVRGGRICAAHYFEPVKGFGHSTSDPCCAWCFYPTESCCKYDECRQGVDRCSCTLCGCIVTMRAFIHPCVGLSLVRCGCYCMRNTAAVSSRFVKSK